MKHLSVIICTYNRAESLRETLASLKQQRFPEGVETEVIVVNNNSRDHTEQVVREAASASPVRFDYLLETRQGLSWARNTGIAKARGDVLAFLDDDVLLATDWLEGLVRCFRETAADALGGRIDMKWLCEAPVWLTDDLKAPLISQDLGPVRREWRPGERTFLGANMAFRRKVFETCGDFRTDLGRKGNSLIGGEDREFFERIAAGGFKIYYEPSAVVFHRVELDRLSQKFYRKWYYDIGRTFGHMVPWRWHHAVMIAPVWVWKKYFQSLGAYVRARMPGGSEGDRFKSEIWLRHHWGVLRERIVHWLPFKAGKRWCPFDEKKSGIS